MNRLSFCFIINILSIILSILAFLLVCLSVIDVNSSGFIVGVLSILVVVLISWNIYSVIDMKSGFQRVRNDLDKRTMENDKATNDVKAMVYSVCADILETQQNRHLEAYEYYLYALRNYLFGKNMKTSVDKTLLKMEASLCNVQDDEIFQSEEMFYTIINEIKNEDLLSDEQREKLYKLENKRKKRNRYQD